MSTDRLLTASASSAGPQARRSNRDRTADSTAALLSAARAQFIDKGFAGTATPDIALAAGLTRGALYHHFEDKTDLFRAVVVREAEAVAAVIEAGTTQAASPADALLAGSAVYLDAMAEPGRARLLLIDAPAVLGRAELDQLDTQTGRASLHQGLRLALNTQAMSEVELDALAEVLSAAFDRAALARVDGRSAANYRTALDLLIRGLLALPPNQTSRSEGTKT